MHNLVVVKDYNVSKPKERKNVEKRYGEMESHGVLSLAQ